MAKRIDFEKFSTGISPENSIIPPLNPILADKAPWIETLEFLLSQLILGNLPHVPKNMGGIRAKGVVALIFRLNDDPWQIQSVGFNQGGFAKAQPPPQFNPSEGPLRMKLFSQLGRIKL